MRIDLLTTFPDMFEAVFGASIIKRAQEAGIVELAVHDLRRWTTDRHHTTDDQPHGGGVGMVMKPEPFFAAVEELRCMVEFNNYILMTSVPGLDFPPEVETADITVNITCVEAGDQVPIGTGFLEFADDGNAFTATLNVDFKQYEGNV